MNFTKLLSWCAFSGALISILLRVVWGWVNSHAPLSLSANLVLQKITVIIWPSSVVLLAATSDQSMANKLFVISLLVNVVLYMLVGALVWLGLNKHFSFFALLALGLAAIWWRLLSL